MTALVNYQNKRVVVRGCFSGMGEATARMLLRLGAEVHGLDYKDSSLALSSFTRVDLRDPLSIDTAAKKIGGRVDALFNCAGLPQTFPPLEVMKVNYAGTRFLTECMLPLMQSGSAIVNVASTAGRRRSTMDDGRWTIWKITRSCSSSRASIPWSTARRS